MIEVIYFRAPCDLYQYLICNRSEIGLKATQLLSSLVEEVNQFATNQRLTFHLLSFLI